MTIKRIVVLVTQSCPTHWDPTDCSPNRLLCSWNSPGKNTGVGCHFLLQGIFLTQRLNPHLLHWGRQILYQLSHWGSPYIIQNPILNSGGFSFLVVSTFVLGITSDLRSSVQFSHSVVSDSLRPHESQYTRPLCPSPTPGVHSDLYPSSQ